MLRLALRRPYTFVVMARLIAVVGRLLIATMPADIFPRIDIPVVSVIWSDGDLSTISSSSMPSERCWRINSRSRKTRTYSWAPAFV